MDVTMPDTNNTPKPEPTVEERLADLETRLTELGGIDKVEKDIAYLRTIIFAVDEKSLQATAKDIDYSADELQSAFLDVREADRYKRYSDNEVTVVLFAAAVKAAKRSIEYSSSTRAARKQSEAMERYMRWATANPKLAANPLTDLPTRFGYGLLSEDVFKTLFAEAQLAAKQQASAASAAI